MNLKSRTLSAEIEYCQEIRNIKIILKAFQNSATIFKINFIDFSYAFFFLHVGLLGFVVVAYQFRVQL